MPGLRPSEYSDYIAIAGLRPGAKSFIWKLVRTN